MPQGAPGLGLPLVDHLVEQRTAGPGPAILPEVPEPQRNFRPFAQSPSGTELPQTAAHQAGKPDRGRAEGSVEVPGVELGVERLEPGKGGLIFWPGRLRGPADGLRRRSVGVDRESHQNPLRRTPVRPAGSGPGPFRDGGNHLVGGRRIAAMDPERAAEGQADEDSPIGVEDHRNRLGQAKGPKPGCEDWFEHAHRIRP